MPNSDLKLIKFVIHRHIQLFDMHVSMQFNLCATASSVGAHENAGHPPKLRVSMKTTGCPRGHVWTSVVWHLPAFFHSIILNSPLILSFILPMLQIPR